MVQERFRDLEPNTQSLHTGCKGAAEVVVAPPGNVTLLVSLQREFLPGDFVFLKEGDVAGARRDFEEAVHLWNEVGAPYETVNVHPRRRDEIPVFGEVNPLKRVPSLREGAVEVYETGAVLAWLGDRFGEAGLAPAIDDAHRGAYLRWLFWLSNTLHQAWWPVARSSRWRSCCTGCPTTCGHWLSNGWYTSGSMPRMPRRKRPRSPRGSRWRPGRGRSRADQGRTALPAPLI